MQVEPATCRALSVWCGSLNHSAIRHLEDIDGFISMSARDFCFWSTFVPVSCSVGAGGCWSASMSPRPHRGWARRRAAGRGARRARVSTRRRGACSWPRTCSAGAGRRSSTRSGTAGTRDTTPACALLHSLINIHTLALNKRSGYGKNHAE